MSVKVKGDSPGNLLNYQGSPGSQYESQISQRHLIPRSSASLVEPQPASYQGIYFNNID